VGNEDTRAIKCRRGMLRNSSSGSACQKLGSRSRKAVIYYGDRAQVEPVLRAKGEASDDGRETGGPLPSQNICARQAYGGAALWDHGKGYKYSHGLRRTDLCRRLSGVR